MKTRMIAITLSALGTAATGCLDDGLKRACDETGQCLNGYTCVQQMCVSTGGHDGATVDMSGPHSSLDGTDLAVAPHDQAMFPVVDIATVTCIPTGGAGEEGTCQLGASCAATSYRLGCDGTQCWCSLNGVVLSSFAQPQACPPAQPVGWMDIAWSMQCGFPQ
jgi:hypothetical protein